MSFGGGTDYDRIKARIKFETVENVLMLGSRTDVEEIVYSSEIELLFTYSEGFPNSVMEYMALKKTIIVSDEGCSRELVMAYVCIYNI